MKGFPAVLSTSAYRALIVALVVSVGSGVFVAGASAEQTKYASKQRQAAAEAYYARTRTMLVEALAEFEQGRSLARPDLLIDAEDWRLKIITLTEQLNTLIDPKIRITRDGVRMRAHPRLIKREKDQLPEVEDAARNTNTYGEDAPEKEAEEETEKKAANENVGRTGANAVAEVAQDYDANEAPDYRDNQTVSNTARARLELGEISDAEDASIDAAIQRDSEVKIDQQQALVDKVVEQAIDDASMVGKQSAPDAADEVLAPSLENAETINSELGKTDQSVTSHDDQRIASAIEQTIQNQLQNLDDGLKEDQYLEYSGDDSEQEVN